MRKVFAALVTGSALSMAASAAMADGLPGGYRDCCHTANFGGFYVGVHGGYGVADPLSATLYDDNFLGETLHVNNPKGGLLGVHGGFNVQIGQACCSAAIVGIEVDHSWRVSGWSGTVANAETDSVASKLNGLSSLRGRAGVVVNNLMLYGTGGLAWAQTKFSYRDADSTTPNISISDTKIGVVGGAGAEWNVAGNLLLRAEWLHYAFGRDDLIPNAFPPEESSIANRFSSVDVIRVGLDYRFGDRRQAPLK